MGLTDPPPTFASDAQPTARTASSSPGVKQPADAEPNVVEVDERLSPIMVTAQRREELQQKVPLAVSVLSSDLISDAGMSHFDEIQFFVPAFESEPNLKPFLSTFRLRGLGNIANIPNFEPDVGLFVDGAYRSRSGLSGDILLDIERVEVLRGPQSVLYPKNVTAGLVNLITRQPGDAVSSHIEAEVGNLGRQMLRAGVSGPIGARVRAGLSIASSARGGDFRDLLNLNRNGSTNQDAARVNVSVDVTDTVVARIVVGASQRFGDCCDPDVLPGPLSTAILLASGLPVDLDPTNRVTAYNSPSVYDGRQNDLLLDLGFDFARARLSVLISHDQYRFESSVDVDQSAIDIGRFDDRQNAVANGQELRLAGTGLENLDWMVGAFHHENDFQRGTLDPQRPLIVIGPGVLATPLPGAPGDQSSFRSRNDTRHISAFAQLGWQTTPRLKLAAGARAISERSAIDVSSTSQILASPSFAEVIGVPAPVRGQRETEEIAWNLSAQYSALASLDLYASVAEGFKPGGFNGDWDPTGELTADAREFSDATILSREIGLKGRFVDDRLSVNLSVFDSDYDAFQNASFLGTSFLVRNAEDVRIRGVELDGEARPATWLLLNYGIAYLDAVYERFTRGPCAFGSTPADPLQGTCDLSGDALPNAPRWRGALGVQVEGNLGTGRAYARLDGSHVASHASDFALDPRARQDAYTLVNARAGWVGEHWRVAVWCKNATDTTAILVSGPQNIFGGVDGGLQYFLAEPRTWGLTLEYSWQ
jgi:iron complex outermembrane receptor protein